MVVAFCALFVSACALYISVQEVRIMRSQQKAAMFPYLTVGKSYNADGFGLRIENTGNGLAKVHSYQVFNDTVFFKDWFDVIKTYAPEAKNINWNIMSSDGYLRNQMVTPLEEKTLIFVRWTPESRILERRLADLKVRVCYSSLLDEYWFLDGAEPKLMEQPCKFEVEKEFGL
ncbi:MAG: hypothetical protein KTR30_38660 [Saprospiraceae bacterium]|nr:hypothetical protein [Saprospiraceae bacterium]